MSKTATKEALTVIKKLCLRCDYNWVSLVEEPVKCPRCQSRIWNKKPKTKTQRRTN